MPTGTRGGPRPAHSARPVLRGSAMFADMIAIGVLQSTHRGHQVFG